MYRRRDEYDDDLEEDYRRGGRYERRRPRYEEGEEAGIGGKLKEWKDDIGETIGSAVNYAGKKMDDWSGRSEDPDRLRGRRRYSDERGQFEENADADADTLKRRVKGSDRVEWTEYPKRDYYQRNEFGERREDEGRKHIKKKTHKKDNEAELHEIEDTIDQMKVKGGDVDILCLDSSKAANDVLKFAIRSVPKSHTLLLLHGTYAPLGGLELDAKKDRIQRKTAKKQLKRMCYQNGRKCTFKHFDYSSNTDMGEKVCNIARRKDVGSVIVGRRGEVSDLRRTLLGSPSMAVMHHCQVPVTLITTTTTNPAANRPREQMELGIQ